MSPPSRNGASPEVSFSFLVAPPPKSPSVRPFHFAFYNYSQVGKTTSYWRLFRHLEVQLDLFVAQQVHDHYLLHAGAVARNGAGIILPGASGSGKSSLTLALLNQGYRYLSDELGVVSPSTGGLHAFPKPISIKDISVFPDLADRDDFWLGPEDGERGREEPVWYAHPEDVRADSISGPVPIRYIIFPRYDPAAPPQLQPMSPDEAVRQLIDNSVNFSQFGKHGLHLLAALVEDAQCFSLTSNDLEETTALINELTQG